MTEKERRAWHWTWFTSALCVISLALAFVFYSDGKELAAYTIAESFAVRDARELNSVLSERDRYLKITSFYAEMAAVHWRKWSPAYSRKPKLQGMNRDQKARVFREMYELSRMLDIPPMSFPATSAIESSGSPGAETDYESGLYQHRHEAVGQAYIFFHRMPSAWQKRVGFVYNDRKDLLDPVNATRVEACLLWGLKNMFHGDMSWAITAKHWGLSRIYGYHRKGVLPPREFKFNVGTINEDIRQPFTYYFVFNEFFQQFNKFNTEVNIPTPWIDAYKKRSGKLEWEFITLRKDVMKVREAIRDLREEKEKFENYREKKNEEIDKTMERLENKYRELSGMIRKGRFTNVKEVYILGRQHFKELMKDMVDPKIEANRKLAIAILVFITVTAGGLASLGGYFLIRKAFRK